MVDFGHVHLSSSETNLWSHKVHWQRSLLCDISFHWFWKSLQWKVWFKADKESEEKRVYVHNCSVTIRNSLRRFSSPSSWCCWRRAYITGSLIKNNNFMVRVRGTFCSIYKTYQVLAADGGICRGKSYFLRKGKFVGSEICICFPCVFSIYVCVCIYLYICIYTQLREKGKKSISVILKDFSAAVPSLPPSLCNSHYDIFRK